jgi:putative ABC transport system permease protein
MNLLKIAYRNVSRQKRRSNLLAIAIAFGVMIIILVNSLTTGLVNNTQNNFESVLGGHIYITGEVMLDSGKVVSRINNTEVLDVVIPQFADSILDYQKRSTLSGTFVFRSKSTFGSVYGVHWDEEQALRDSLELVEGSLDRVSEPQTIVLPKEIADELGVVLNEKILLSFSTVTGQANVGEFTIIALIKDATGLGFTAAYTDISYANVILGLEPDEYQSFNIILKNIAMINPFTTQLEKAIEAEGALLKPEEEDAAIGGMPMHGMFSAAEKEDPWVGTRFNVGNLNDYMDMVTQIVGILYGLALGMFLIMLSITMIGLVNTFRMIMIERTKEIGTMRAVGMLQKDVTKLFFLEGIILVLRGAIFGIIAALGVGFILGAITFKEGSNFAIMLSGGHISVPIVPSNILMVTGIIAIITVIAVWSPARKASRLQPADALRA